ncbi:MAG: SCO family protein [Planctomycetota bacterium]|nr:SCO family protein [Planctomycetota bacterium]
MHADTMEKPGKGTEGVLGWLSWSLLAVGILVVVAYAAVWEPPRVLIRHGEVPAFELDDQEGAKVSRESLRGKVWVGTFMFTNCGNACPGMAAELLKIQKTIRNEDGLADKLRLVSFSLDPGRDTPLQLAQYSSQQGIDSDYWSFLRGERGEIVRLCEQGFRMSAGRGREAGADPGVPHSDRFALVDAEGIIRGYYRPSSIPDDLEKLLDAARILIEENQQE